MIEKERPESAATDAAENRREGGPFARWQPKYAKYGVPLFPVRVTADSKKPLVKNYLKTSAKTSLRFAEKFANAASFGFVCGASTGITVADLDSTDPAIIAEAERMFGPTPLHWATGSGKFALAYRHAGERRHVRAFGKDGPPIDLLGRGFAVAPPSAGTAQNYEIIKGGLDDLAHLPVARIPDEIRDRVYAADRVIETEFLPSMVAEKPELVVNDGARNNALFQHCMGQAHFCDDFEALLDVARTFSEMNSNPPLADKEVVRTATSAWGYTERGENLVGMGRAVVLHHRELDLLVDDPDAFWLYGVLRRHHWGRDFVVANDMHENYPISLDRLRKARKKLITRKLIIQTKPNRGPGRPAQYRFASMKPHAH
jgi:hypothetical protein